MPQAWIELCITFFSTLEKLHNEEYLSRYNMEVEFIPCSAIHEVPIRTCTFLDVRVNNLIHSYIITWNSFVLYVTFKGSQHMILDFWSGKIRGDMGEKQDMYVHTHTYLYLCWKEGKKRRGRWMKWIIEIKCEIWSCKCFLCLLFLPFSSLFLSCSCIIYQECT